MRSRERVTSPLTKVEKVWGLAKFSALTTTFCGVALHLMGSAYHRTYLKNWGIDTGLFEKTTDWILVSAHYVLVDRTALLLNLLAKHMVALFGITAVIALGLWVARHFKLFALFDVPKTNRAIPAWLDSAIKAYTGFAMLLTAVLVAFFVLIFPPLQGELVGKSIAEKHLQALADGCPAQPSTTRCVTLLRDGQRIAHGFVIDSSATHIAIFDIATREARAIERHRLELKSAPVPDPNPAQPE